CRRSAQCRFCSGVAPGLMRHAAEREPGILDVVSVELEPGRDRDKRKSIGEPVADLKVGVVRCKALRRKLDCGEYVDWMHIRVELRRVSWQAMEIRKGDDPVSSRPCNMHLCLECCERNTHVGRMGRDAVLARAEDRMHTMKAVNGGAAAAGLA